MEMQSAYTHFLPSCSHRCPIPKKTYLHQSRLNPNNTSPNSLPLISFSKTHSKFSTNCSITVNLTPTRSCSIKQNNNKKKTQSNPPIYRFVHQFSSSTEANGRNNQNPEAQDQEGQEKEERKQKRTKKNRGLFPNMWWVDMKAALGQRLNVGAIVSSAVVVVKDQHLALPHVFVPDVRYIDWNELHRRGFKGVVFDKDNTITAPYRLELWGPLNSSLERCKLVFGHDIAVFSNSAGLQEYDHDASKAKALEGAIGIKVIRHRVKKPAGTAEEIEKHFGCESSQLIMVGDRPFTDVVFGNRNGFLTILTEPLSPAGEPFIVQQVRKLEMTLLNRWFKKGLRPQSHRLLPDATRCVKDPQPQ